MASLDLGQVKRQASSFLREKIRTARLVFTDVTEAELLTEEATNSDPWGPETRAMAAISQAAFEVDNYWRIVEILHKRLSAADKKRWRESFKTLVLLEYLLTHGPESVAVEFRCDNYVIQQLADFQCIDEKGFDWGVNVRRKVERILELLSEERLLKEERNRARKVSREIRGFGSFISRTPSSASSEYSSSRTSSFSTIGSFNSTRDDTEAKTSTLCDKEDNGSADETSKSCGEDSTTRPGLSTDDSLSDQSSSDDRLWHNRTSTIPKISRSQTEKWNVSHDPNGEWKPFKEENTLSNWHSFNQNGIQSQAKYSETKGKSEIQVSIKPSGNAGYLGFQESAPRVESRPSLDSSTGNANGSPSTPVASRGIHPFNDIDKEVTTECLLLSDSREKNPVSNLDFPGSGWSLTKKLSARMSFSSRDV